MIRTAVAATLLVALLAFAARPLAYDRRPRPGFEAAVTGAAQVILGGSAVIGVPADASGPVTLELEAREDGSALLLHWSFASFPRATAYRTGTDGAPVLHAYFARGSRHPETVFRGAGGIIRIRHASPDLLTGTFELLATAPERHDARRDTTQVRISGSFVATTVSP